MRQAYFLGARVCNFQSVGGCIVTDNRLSIRREPHVELEAVAALGEREVE
jgi:hypothetical protein